MHGTTHIKTYMKEQGHNKNVTMTFYNKKEQFYLETNALGIGKSSTS